MIQKKGLAIVYIDDVNDMHEAWDWALGTLLKKRGVKTLHCIGYEPDHSSTSKLELLKTHELLNSLRSYDIKLIVSDVRMPFPGRGRGLGGIEIVRQVAIVLEGDMPPVLFASARPEKELQAILAKEQDLTILGEVWTDGDDPDSPEQWQNILQYIMKCLDQFQEEG